MKAKDNHNYSPGMKLVVRTDEYIPADYKEKEETLKEPKTEIILNIFFKY
jgi:hypothetical protein